MYDGTLEQPTLPARTTTYQDLVNRIDEVLADQPARNHKSTLNTFLLHHGFTLESPVGDEFLHANTFAGNVTAYINECGSATTSLPAKKSHLKAIRKIALDLHAAAGLPDGFGEALCELKKRDGASYRALSRSSGVPEVTITRWGSQRSIPTYQSLDNIKKLEKALGAPAGTLTSRMNSLERKTYETGGTKYREKQQELRELSKETPYRLKEEQIPEMLKQEFRDFATYKKALVPPNDLKRYAKWEKPATEKLSWNGYVLPFCSFLALPPSPDPRVSGLGMDPDTLTLAHFADTNLIFRYLDFMTARSASGGYHNGHKTFLSFATMLVNKEKGYLTQLPSFRMKIDPSMSEDEWVKRCVKAYETYREAAKGMSKRRKMPQSRVTDDPLRNILEMGHPLEALITMNKLAEEDFVRRLGHSEQLARK